VALETTCVREGCSGEIVDGRCAVCGLEPDLEQPGRTVTVTARRQSEAAAGARAPIAASAPTVVSSWKGSRRTAATRTTTTTRTTRSRLGAGLVEVPPVPFRDPSDAVLAAPEVAEGRRFCGRCGEPVGRARNGGPGRTEGFCVRCRAPFSFAPKLEPGDLVADQYEVVGCLAHGGMGWVYLAKDRNVSDRWVVLKGLLNTGDEGAMAAALAERRFLAEVEHPNIVKIFNFVKQERSGYIVMEYVGGTSLKEMLAERRVANGGEPNPLPVAQAIAYVLEVLPALGHLHQSGLLFCDLKVDNVIQTQHSLKLIDLGGVYRMDDESSPVYGTVGYQAPEIADTGPTVPSDLFTVARTLAVLCIDFEHYQDTLRYTLPTPDEAPLYARFDSLYRFLLKGTAARPDDRFQSAEEMGEQLYGVLREVVSEVDGVPTPAPSTLFTGGLRSRVDAPDRRALPLLRVSADDPAAGYLATLGATEPDELVELLRNAPERTVEVDLRLARALVDAGDDDEAEAVATAIQKSDPWEWRAAWYRGLADLARGRATLAGQCFETVYRAVPGELAPKLALALAAEEAGDHTKAATWYDVVSRTDPGYTTAAFGLARSRLATGDRRGALTAYDRVPESSSVHGDAQIARIRCLIGRDEGYEPELLDLREGAAGIESLTLDDEQRARLSSELLESAGVAVIEQGSVPSDPDEELLGCPLTETGLRTGLEASYRELARIAKSSAERVRLVDLANEVRPRTWT
jgi:serine/threonine-protein kinase PknG